MKTKIAMGLKMSLGMTILALLIHISCQNSTENEVRESNEIPVRVTRSIRQKVAFPIRTSGILSSKKEMKLSFKTGGIIDRIYVDEGQQVSKGQLLASLNLSEIDAQVNLARLGVEKAKRDLGRAENLYRDSVATLEQFQNARTALNYAESQLEIAVFNREYSLIKAPAPGKVLKKLAETDEMIAPGYPLFLFASSESDWVLRVALSDRDLVKIKTGDAASISFDAFPRREFEAEVAETATSSDPFTGTYEVELRILHPEKKFVTGLIGAAIIIPARKENYLSLPVQTLHEAEGDKAYIYVADDSSYYKKTISIALITDSLIYFTADLDTNALIISEGAEYLNPTAGIRIVE